MDILILVRGIIIGLMVSMPMGPIGVVVLQRTLNKGRLSGLSSGLGAASADALFATIAVFGMKFVIDFITFYKPLLEVIGGVLVIIIGLRVFSTNPAIQLRKSRRNPTPLYRDYFYTLVLTLSNPLYIFIFLAFFASVNLVSDSHVLKNLPYFLIVMGVMTGSLCWYMILSTLAGIFRKKLRLKVVLWINRIAGLTIAIFGIVAITDAFIHWPAILNSLSLPPHK